MSTIRRLLTLAALALFVQVAAADDGCALGSAGKCGAPECCAHCGRHAACQPKVCQVVCETTKVKKHYWSVECQEFCPLLPGCGSLRGCDCCGACGDQCDGSCCDQCGPHCEKKCLVPPRCGHPRCVKKLVKKEYECEVPVYKCVVKYLCGQCCDKDAKPAFDAAPASAAPPSAPLPPAPKPNPSARRSTHLTPR